MDILYSFTAG